MTSTPIVAETGIALPKYVCHKEVWALKIGSIERGPQLEDYIMVPDDTHYAPFKLSAEYMRKHNPTAGGYWVQYKDGYQSFSPAKAFEEGYVPSK